LLNYEQLKKLYGNYFVFPENQGSLYLRLLAGILDTSGGVGYISNAIKVFLSEGLKKNPKS
jgi:hypothetical protein